MYFHDSNTGKYGPEKTPLLDTFYAVQHCQGNREEDGLCQFF